MALLVSIHDVTPAFTRPVTELWKLCRRFGVAPALFLVPNWHGAWPLQAHPGFMSWIRECVNEGAEVMLHGQRHDEVGLPRSFADNIRAFGRTAREGEFLTLDRSAATTRIRDGMKLFQKLGVEPVGFVPPAWLAKEETFASVQECGLRVSEDISGVRVHARADHLKAPAIRWSGRTPLRANASAGLASARWRLQRGRPLMRLALHPQDLDHPVSARSVHREVERWLTLGPVMRYAEL